MCRFPYSAAMLSTVELRTAIRQARYIGPDPKNLATLVIQWTASLAGLELTTIHKLVGPHKAACGTMLAAEF